MGCSVVSPLLVKLCFVWLDESVCNWWRWFVCFDSSGIGRDKWLCRLEAFQLRCCGWSFMMDRDGVRFNRWTVEEKIGLIYGCRRFSWDSLWFVWPKRSGQSCISQWKIGCVVVWQWRDELWQRGEATVEYLVGFLCWISVEGERIGGENGNEGVTGVFMVFFLLILVCKAFVDIGRRSWREI